MKTTSLFVDCTPSGARCDHSNRRCVTRPQRASCSSPTIDKTSARDPRAQRTSRALTALGTTPGGGNLWNCPRVLAGAIKDGAKECKGDCPVGWRKILVVVADNGMDYHFYREDNDGSWSHKRGYGGVESGVKNPKVDAISIGYGDICGYLCVPMEGCDADKK